MKQARVGKIGHDRHEGVEACELFRYSTGTRRAKHRQADPDRVREASLRLAARTGGTILQSGPLAMAQRTIRPSKGR